MRRRTLVMALGGAIASPAVVRAQPAKPVIGYLSARSLETDGHLLGAFRAGLKQAGYVEGENVTIDFRWCDGNYDRLPDMAAELMRGKPDVLVAVGGNPTPFALKALTTTIPIVFLIGTDPVSVGLVKSIRQPGGNMTGATLLGPSLEAKRLELVHDMLPRAKTVALLVNPSSNLIGGISSEAQAAAGTLGLDLQVLSATTRVEIDRAFDAMAANRPDALAVSLDGIFYIQRDLILARAAAMRLPAIHPYRECAEEGGLASYSTPLAVQYRALGIYAGRILKGARPSDLPVQQPTTYELVINLRTAKTLGLVLPPAFVSRADDTIE
jgi:putative tryptophan/tyrosine transport system substrate-binding protein